MTTDPQNKSQRIGFITRLGPVSETQIKPSARINSILNGDSSCKTQFKMNLSVKPAVTGAVYS